MEKETINNLALSLEKFGKVEQCEELDGMFHVKITDGFDINMINTLTCAKTINDVVYQKYPYLEKNVTDENLFHLILRPNRKYESKIHKNSQ